METIISGDGPTLVLVNGAACDRRGRGGSGDNQPYAVEPQGRAPTAPAVGVSAALVLRQSPPPPPCGSDW